jgi:hypothetical protein
MQRLAQRLLLVLSPVLAAGVLLTGCGGTDDEVAVPDHRRDKKLGGSSTDKKDEVKQDTLTAVKTKGTATLKGTVKFEGDPPALSPITITKDKDVCEKHGPVPNEAWVVDRNGNVKNVFVWVRPVEKSEFFDVKELAEKGEAYPREVEIKQPYCAFEPHATILFSHYIDPANPQRKRWAKNPRTKQVFQAVNNATVLHNTSWGGDTKRMQGGNRSLSPNDKLKISDIQPDYGSAVTISCSIHPWMRAYLWDLEHPFAAVTKADGTYEIPNVPVPENGKIRVVAWHESANFLNGEQGEVIDLKDSTNTKDFSVRR